ALAGPEESDGAPGMGADLRIGDVALGRPRRPRRVQPQRLGWDADENRLAVGRAHRALREDGEDAVELQIAGLDRRPVAADEAEPLPPGGRELLGAGSWSERQDRDRERGAEPGECGEEHADEQPAPAEARLLAQGGLEVGGGLRAGGCGV